MKNYINKPDILKWYIYKILLIMRLTTVILMVSMLQVSASTVAQEFNYVKKGASLIQIFKEIKKQTGYNIIWNEKKIDVTTTIDADFKKATIYDVLNRCLSNLPVSYSINDKTVMIKEDEPSFRDKIVSFFNAIDVRGRVVDENNVPLVGATVKIKGTNNVTSTNSKGEFILRNVDEKAILMISFLGYEQQEIRVEEKIGDVKLTMREDRLKEVEINAGYYTVKERERTGSISKITASTIEKQPVNNPLMAMVGKVPGLQITQLSGLPGSSFTVQIRGQNSLRSGNDPLYIIDGVPYPSQGISGTRTGGQLGPTGANPMSMINPGDIEAIEVLKDADATAIYGSKGSNGVILVTTKKGRAGNTTVNANIFQGNNRVAHRVDLLNTEEYLAMRREAYKNDGLEPTSLDYDVNGTWDQNKYTDWQKELLGHTALTTNAGISINGGNDKGNYLVSGNFYKEGAVTPGDFGFERMGVRSNINFGSIKDRFNASFTATFNHTYNLFSNAINQFIFLPPNAPDAYDEFGQLNWENNTVITNPLSNLLRTTEASSDALIGNLKLSYRILDHLSVRTSLGYSTIKSQEFSKSPLSVSNPATNPPSSLRTSAFGNQYNNNLIIEPQVNYKAKLGVGFFEALIGLTLQSNNTQLSTISASNFTSDDLLENIGSAATVTGSLNLSQYRYIALFSRLNYKLKDKYFLNLTARRDGSSRFGPGKQFSNFGAVGTAWIFSEEKLIKENLRFLSFGKLRASFGVTGNDQIADYGYLQLWDNNPVYNGISTLTPSTSAANADFAWEVNRKFESSLQLNFLKNKVNLEMSFYSNRSSNQLLSKALSLSTGLSSVQRNLPALVQNSGWEFSADIKIIKSKKFNWQVGTNLTVPENKLLEYPDLASSGLNAILFKIGEPLSIFQGYNVSVNKQTGLYSLDDANNNGNTDVGDFNTVKFLGQYYFGGFENSISYKRFNLDFHFFFVKRNARSFVSNTPVAAGRWANSINSNQFKEVLERWQKNGDETIIQRFTTTTANNSTFNTVKSVGDISVTDASFIRLRNVSISYSLPQIVLSKLRIKNASFNIQGQNLFTLTNYVGLDPEITGIPVLRTLMMGINLTF